MDIAEVSKAIASGAPLALAFGLGAGLLSTIGPCTPTRLAWLGATTSAAPDRYRRVASYVAGIVLGYAALGVIGTALLDRLVLLTPWLYAALGIVALITGAQLLWRGWPTHDHSHKSSHSATFLGGIASALTFLPCCTPVVTATIAAAPSPAFAAMVLACFGIGHSAPAWLVPSTVGWYQKPALQTVALIVSGGLACGIGLYFLVCA
jgi:cytochrome c biogenesis protein CcdA